MFRIIVGVAIAAALTLLLVAQAGHMGESQRFSQIHSRLRDGDGAVTITIVTTGDALAMWARRMPRVGRGEDVQVDARCEPEELVSEKILELVTRLNERD